MHKFDIAIAIAACSHVTWVRPVCVGVMVRTKKPQPDAAPSPSAAAISKKLENQQRGLIVNQKFAHRFITEGKVWEIKHCMVRCMKQGGHFFLVESGIGHNDHGVALFRILAVLEFVDQHRVSWDDLKKKYKCKHACTDEELEGLRASRKSTEGTAVAWEVKVVKVLSTPLYTRYSGQERGNWL